MARIEKPYGSGQMDLFEKFGVFCSVVTYPAVPPDIVQLRLISTAAHDVSDVAPTVEAIRSVVGV